MYFNINFNLFFKFIKVHLLASELYIVYIQMHGATIKITTVSVEHKAGGAQSQPSLFGKETINKSSKHYYRNE